MNLYQINKEIEAIAARIAENPDDETLPMLFANAGGARTEKIENICKLLSNWQADVCELAVEAERLTSRKKRLENEYDRLKRWLMFNLLREGKKSEQTPLYKITVLPPRERIEIEANENAVDWPQEVFEAAVSTSYKVDKALLKNFDTMIRTGQIKGVKIVEGEPGLRIT